MASEAIVRWGFPLVLLGLLWAGMAKGSADSWVVGIPFMLFALSAFGRLRGHRGEGPQLRKSPAFAVWFLWQSLRGGADVAWRALQPRMPLRPGFLRYRMTVPPGPARVFLVNCVSLLPGTLSADIEGDELILHALDTGADVISETGKVEQRVQELYGIRGGQGNG